MTRTGSKDATSGTWLIHFIIFPFLFKFFLNVANENELTEPDPVDDNDNDNEDENENNQNIDIVRINNDKNAEKVEEEKSDNERRTLHSKSESCLQNLKKVPNENLGKVLKEIETLSRSSSWESKVRYCDHKKG